ncbi:MAG: alpha/beta fold hydrolase [Rhizobiaceae bacterium]|nr:alpha/beta fold hydrolase [Rhizobiaceae bacterium]
MIHGFGSESGMWRPLVAALPGERPVLAVDLPSHGLSPSHATSFAAIVDAVAAVLAEEAVPEAHLAGHSLGAAVAVALSDGGQVGARSLFLMSPAGLGPDIDGAFLSGFTRARDAASLAPWMRMLVHDPDSLPASLVDATIRSRGERDLLGAQAALAEDLFPDATQVFSVRAALQRVAVPARIVFGLADRIIPARHTSGLPGTVGLHLFPQVGHMPHLEVRDAVGKLLGEHIR